MNTLHHLPYIQSDAEVKTLRVYWKLEDILDGHNNLYSFAALARSICMSSASPTFQAMRPRLTLEQMCLSQAPEADGLAEEEQLCR